MYEVTEEEHLTNLANAVLSRKREMYSYNFNVVNYTKMLKLLPIDEWPKEIIEYKGMKPEQVLQYHSELFELWSQYSYRDRLRLLLMSEKEAHKQVKFVHDVLIDQIPVDQLGSRLTTAKLSTEAAPIAKV